MKSKNDYIEKFMIRLLLYVETERILASTQIISVYSSEEYVCRKYEGRISTPVAFCLLLGQKFMSIVIGKVSLYGELPTLRDSSFLVLLGIHFVTFTLFHTHTGEDLMNRVR